RLDLIGFLELAQREGFWVLIRPGPYIYAEWPNSGIPDRVVPYHRLHTTYLEEAQRWIAAVSEVLGPFQGEPVVLLQADNEADPWADVYRSPLSPDRTLRHAYATEIVRWTVAAYRACGIEVPIYANTYIDFGIQDWRSIGAECDLVGPDIYPT